MAKQSIHRSFYARGQGSGLSTERLHVKAGADFNGDGKADILWQNDNGTPAITPMDGLSQTSGAYLTNPGPSWHVVDGRDFNGDGKADILWQNDNGTPAITLMDGLSQISGAYLANPGTDWHLIA
jgi:serralysin